MNDTASSAAEMAPSEAPSSPAAPIAPSPPAPTPSSPAAPNPPQPYKLTWDSSKYPNIPYDSKNPEGNDELPGIFVGIANKHGLSKEQAQGAFDDLMTYRDHELETYKRNYSESIKLHEEKVAKEFPDLQQITDHIHSKAKSFGMPDDQVNNLSVLAKRYPDVLNFVKNYMSEHNTITKSNIPSTPTQHTATRPTYSRHDILR